MNHISITTLSRRVPFERNLATIRGVPLLLHGILTFCFGVAIYFHISLADFLTAKGYDVLSVAPRFLPLTVKPHLPVSPWLIGAYLASPIEPLGKQMLLSAKPKR